MPCTVAHSPFMITCCKSRMTQLSASPSAGLEVNYGVRICYRDTNETRLTCRGLHPLATTCPSRCRLDLSLRGVGLDSSPHLAVALHPVVVQHGRSRDVLRGDPATSAQPHADVF